MAKWSSFCGIVKGLLKNKLFQNPMLLFTIFKGAALHVIHIKKVLAGHRTFFLEIFLTMQYQRSLFTQNVFL
jgi:hypothetical protein